MQSYSAMPENLRKQDKTMFVWYPVERSDIKTMRDENNVLTDDKLVMNFGKYQSMFDYVSEMNIPMDLRY